MKTTEYKHLTPYTRSSYYIGETWEGWYAIAGQSRDSSALERSNYRKIFEDLKTFQAPIDLGECGPDNDGDSVVDTRCSHWACGWVETIYVHSSNTVACQRADEILEKLGNYPVFDEDDFDSLETEELEQYWANCGMSERIDICKRAGVSFLQARRKSLWAMSDRLYDWYRDHYSN